MHNLNYNHLANSTTVKKLFSVYTRYTRDDNLKQEIAYNRKVWQIFVYLVTNVLERMKVTTRNKYVQVISTWIE